MHETEAEKKRRWHRYALMNEWRPDLFWVDDPIPLKVGIREDLLKHPDNPLSKRQTPKFLRWYTRQESYLSAMMRAEHRVGIDGSLSDISVLHRQIAAAKLAEIVNARVA